MNYPHRLCVLAEARRRPPGPDSLKDYVMVVLQNGDGADRMTALSKVAHTNHDRRMESVKQALARAMAREVEFRAAEREDRMQRLGLDRKADVPSNRSRLEDR
jgi:hypothetical protein